MVQPEKHQTLATGQSSATSAPESVLAFRQKTGKAYELGAFFDVIERRFHDNPDHFVGWLDLMGQALIDPKSLSLKKRVKMLRRLREVSNTFDSCEVQPAQRRANGQ